MQFFQFLRFGGNVGEVFCYLVGDVGPAGREQVHFYHGVAVVFECAGGHETLPFGGIREAISGGGGGGGIFRFLCGVMSV